MTKLIILSDGTIPSDCEFYLTTDSNGREVFYRRPTAAVSNPFPVAAGTRRASPAYAAPPATPPAPVAKAPVTPPPPAPSKEDLEKAARDVGGTYEEREYYSGGHKLTDLKLTLPGHWRPETITTAYNYDMVLEDRGFMLYEIRKYKAELPRKIVGVSDAGRVQCSASVHHGFHPTNEKCPWC